MAKFPARPTASALAVACALASSATVHAGPAHRSPNEAPAKLPKAAPAASSKPRASPRVPVISRRGAPSPAAPRPTRHRSGPRAPSFARCATPSASSSRPRSRRPGTRGRRTCPRSRRATTRRSVYATGLPPADPRCPRPPPKGRGLAWLAHLELPGLAGALGRARRSLPRVLPRRPARARDVREPLPALGPLARDDAPRLRQEVAARGPGLGLDDRERLRRTVARSSVGRARASGSSCRRPRRSTASRSTAGSTSASARAAATDAAADFLARSAPPLRQLGARARRLQHGLRRARVGRAPLQHERLLVARAHRGHAAVGDDALRAEDPRRGGRRAQPRARSASRTSAVDPPVETDEVDVPPGTPLALVAQAAGCTPKDIESLNPELRAARTPPAERRGRGLPGQGAAGQGRRRRAGALAGCGATSRRSSATSCASARRWSRSPTRTRRRRRSSSR